MENEWDEDEDGEDAESRVDWIFERLNRVAETNLECILDERDGIQATNNNATITVTRGIVDTLDDDELAWVIAHEISHIIKRHRENIGEIVDGFRGIVKEVCDDENRGFVGKLFISSILTGMCYLRTREVSRVNEYDADEVALELMEEAGFDSQSADSALQKVAGGSEGGITSTHPSTYDRVRNMRGKRK